MYPLCIYAMKLVSFKMEEKFLERVDYAATHLGFANRTELIRQALREKVELAELRREFRKRVFEEETEEEIEERPAEVREVEESIKEVERKITPKELKGRIFGKLIENMDEGEEEEENLLEQRE